MTLLQSGSTGGVPAPTSPHDSILVVQTPQGFRLPGGASTLTRALFDRPQEVQWAAISVGVLLFALLAFLALRYRGVVLRWLATRSRAVTVGLGVVAMIGVIAFGVVGWNGYQLMEHDNAFCTSCHLMHPMIAKFYETKHRRLECHDCHKQSKLADMKELKDWVFERPGKIPAHENAVPNEICEGCHFAGHTPEGMAASDARAQGATLINTSAAHMVHLRSKEQPGITCTQCHARPSRHVFTPSNQTCQQAGCHDEIRIKLSDMQGVHNLKCTGCHDFRRKQGTIKPPFQAAERTIVPVRDQCLACHQMADRAKGQSFAGDPHRAQCGLCHNPHRQADAKSAEAACSSGGCHARVDTLSSFHVGIPARALAHCANCHSPHTWKARGKVCADCHATPDGPLPGESPGRRRQAAPAARAERTPEAAARGLSLVPARGRVGAPR